MNSSKISFFFTLLVGLGCFHTTVAHTRADVFTINNCTGEDLYLRIRCGQGDAYEILENPVAPRLVFDKEAFLFRAGERIEFRLSTVKLPLRIRAWCSTMDMKAVGFALGNVQSALTNICAFARMITADDLASNGIAGNGITLLPAQEIKGRRIIRDQSSLEKQISGQAIQAQAINPHQP